jgi:hypothetical protein
MEIDVLGHVYLVEEKELDQKDDMGCAKLLDGRILIDQEMSPDLKGETLQHEVFECLNWWGDLQLAHHQIFLLSTLYYNILSGNPDYVRYLIDSFVNKKIVEGVVNG